MPAPRPPVAHRHVDHPQSATPPAVLRAPRVPSGGFDPGLLIVVVIWGLNFPLIKVPLEVMHPFAVNLLRFAIGAIVLGALWTVEARRQGIPFLEPLRGRWAALVGLGLLGHVAYQALFILGVARTAAGSAALLLASSPVWTALLSHVSGQERLRAGRALGLALSAAGVVVVVLGGRGAVEFSGETFVGNMLMLGSALAWALYTVLSRPLLTGGTAPLPLTFFSVMMGLPFIVALGLPTVGAGIARAGPAEWGALLFSGVLSNGIANVLWYGGVRRVGPAATAAFSNLVPFVALLASWLLLGEAVTLPQFAGGALIIGGLWVVRSRVRGE